MTLGNFTQTIGSFLAVTGFVAAFSWWRTRRMDNRDAQTYFLANRRLPWIQVAGSLLLTNLSTEQFIGLNGAASVYGAMVMGWEVVAVFGLLAMAWYFLPRYWVGNITTIPEFLEQRFDRSTRHLMGVVMLLAIVLNILPFVLYSGGVAMSAIFHVPEHLGISAPRSFFLMAWVIGLIGAIYVVLGGMKAVALSDTLYGAGLLAGGLLIPVLALMRLGNGHLGAGLARVIAHQAPMLNPVGDSASNVPFGTLFTGMLFINLFYWCTNQIIVQRAFGASSFAEAQKGVLATAALKLLGPAFLVFPGIIAAEMFGGALGNGDLAYAKLVEAVLPDFLVGFFAAVLLGSVISAFNGGLHSATTLFSLDVYRSWLRPQATEREMLKAGKIFAVVACVIAILTSRLFANSPEGVFTLVKRLMAAFKLPLLAVVAMGMLTRAAPAWSAKIVLVGGIVTSFLLDWLLGHGTFGVTIHWLHLAALNVLLLCVFMAGAGRLTPSAQTIARASDSIDPAVLVPWKHLRIATVLTAAGAVGVYFLFWKISHAG